VISIRNVTAETIGRVKTSQDAKNLKATSPRHHPFEYGHHLVGSCFPGQLSSGGKAFLASFLNPEKKA
jgi:hypothetical protein